ncbi:hypothetical protein EIP91_004295 [Steccherinum ochraceum]|uniref:Uncharacterized protein n=1 Tax=Steccherinum ochraceum TaxID=92696 RepID=A0A4V2MVY6_9APHY|nr:hypothetical protein EIP91_004295 [Steccherinum ochraceum]
MVWLGFVIMRLTCQAIDKAGRTGRRAVDTHVKHAISRPRLATTMRPPVVSKVETPEFAVPKLTTKPAVSADPEPPKHSKKRERTVSPEPSNSKAVKDLKEEPETAPPPPPPGNPPDEGSDSVTEEEEEELSVQPVNSPSKGKAREQSPPAVVDNVSSSAPSPEKPVANPYYSREPSPKHKEPTTKDSTPAETGSESQGSSVRPSKKLKRRPIAQSSSDEDSEDEQKPRATASRKATAPRGAKQPLKRGGRRF